MDELAGLSFVGSGRGARGERTFRAHDPVTGEALEPPYHPATPDEVERACRLAEEAFASFGRSDASARARLLRGIAAGLEANRDALVARAHAESGLPLPRLGSEVGRTAAQLRLFASVAEEGAWLDARIDTADPARKPPRPDVRSMQVPLGPVAVFGSSNFPLAFSVAGGDTASALAAGNPVIVKAHPLHPGTSELTAAVVAAAVREAGLPEGTFSLLYDDRFAVGQALVTHPLVRAVGFTGSRAGGEALMRLAASREDPIPFYAEMGSVNPVVIMPGALRTRGAAIADGLHASFTLGVGQFCTNPGVVLLDAGAEGDAFASRLSELTLATPAAPMLGASISSAYRRGLSHLKGLGARLLAEGPEGTLAAGGQAALWEVDAPAALAQPGLLEEVFGPTTVLVRTRSEEERSAVLTAMGGHLTATVHAEPEELASAAPLLAQLSRMAGRVVVDQFPTGVEVNHAMVHGGPFPATSDGRTTSVGSRAIDRFSRLVAFQNFPDGALPEELRDANPRGVRRLVNGVPATGPIAG